jgi:parallel beta-helix repeat protein
VKGWIIVAGLASLSLGAPARAGTLTVNCPGDSLQAAVELAVAGDTIQVTGTCTESVLIRNEQVRIALDGQSVATISPTSGHAAFTVRGKGITIRNFTITGGPGAGIWVNRGSNAVITQNHIYAMGGNGVTVNQLSFAVIRNNNIHDNAGDGIAISETSDSRIGFDQNYDTAASPNTIQSNGGRGITVSGSSKARIVGNTIAGNTGWHRGLQERSGGHCGQYPQQQRRKRSQRGFQWRGPTGRGQPVDLLRSTQHHDRQEL